MASPELAYTEHVHRDGSRRRVMPDGRQMQLPPYRFNADGLASVHDPGFLADAKFRAAYEAGARTGHRICAPQDLHIEWRVYVCCWAALHAARLPGDFVECGVSTGIVSLAVCHYLDFASLPRTFWLFDTWQGIPETQASEAEAAQARSKNERVYFDAFDMVTQTFSAFPNVKLVRGEVPGTLESAALDAIAYLHVDMNIAYPEVEASRRLWDRMTPGGLVVYDDYGSPSHAMQKRALDAFAAERGVRILALPTGQGLLIKA
jgi:O-methyltransferase